jgi:iron complex outermembrane receptor protein
MTYNRAFSTPDNNNLYLDLLQSKDPFHTGIDVRVQGVPATGFHWSTNAAGPQFRSQFSPLIGDTIGTFYDFNDTSLTNIAWGVGIQLAQGALAATLAETPGMDPATAAAIVAAVGAVAPTSINQPGYIMRALNLDTGNPEVVDNSFLKDIARLEPSITQTFELGYKGTLGNRIRFSVDAYRTKKDNFVGPLSVETPTMWLDIDATLAAEIGPIVLGNYAAASPQEQQLLMALDANESGSPVDELIAMYITGGASTSFGTVSPEEALNPNDVLITYRNFGDITYYGADLSFNFHLNRSWDFGGSYSYVSKNFFPKGAEQVHDIRLNAPRNKFGLFAKYHRPTRKLMTEARVRYVDAFDMDSPFLGSRVKSYILLDLNLGIDVVANTRFTLSVENVADHMHIEFVGAPAIGRLAIARLTQTF